MLGAGWPAAPLLGLMSLTVWAPAALLFAFTRIIATAAPVPAAPPAVCFPRYGAPLEGGSAC
jgi:hypothetical protein